MSWTIYPSLDEELNNFRTFHFRVARKDTKKEESQNLNNKQNQTARGHPALKDEICFGQRAPARRNPKSSSLRLPKSPTQKLS